MESPTSSTSPRSDEQSLGERWRKVKARLQQEIQRLREEVLQEEQEAAKISREEQASVDDMFKDYVYEEHAEFSRLQWKLQKARVENLGQELAAMIQGRIKPDFLSPWYATTMHYDPGLEGYYYGHDKYVSS